jgi:hypothetical protein
VRIDRGMERAATEKADPRPGGQASPPFPSRRATSNRRKSRSPPRRAGLTPVRQNLATGFGMTVWGEGGAESTENSPTGAGVNAGMEKERIKARVFPVKTPGRKNRGRPATTGRPTRETYTPPAGKVC